MQIISLNNYVNLLLAGFNCGRTKSVLTQHFRKSQEQGKSSLAPYAIRKKKFGLDLPSEDFVIRRSDLCSLIDTETIILI